MSLKEKKRAMEQRNSELVEESKVLTKKVKIMKKSTSEIPEREPYILEQTKPKKITG